MSLGGGLYFYKCKNNLVQLENVHYNSKLKASTGLPGDKTSPIASEKQHKVVPNIKTHFHT